MQKLLLSIALSISLIPMLHGKSIEEATARTVAQTYLTVHQQLASPSLDLAFLYSKRDVSGQESTRSADKPLYYIFDIGIDQGFIIVAGDDNSVPILGYVPNGHYNPNDQPPNFRKWMDEYKMELEAIVDNNLRASPSILAQWAALESGSSTSPPRSSTVNPLLSTTWDQSPYYNDLCPGGSVTGCVATAMAQILKYWEYPTQGTGFHSYNEDNYGSQSVNFATTTYQWSSMPNNLTGPNNAVAVLMYHCGVSVDMDYSPQVSGAWVIENSPAPQACSEYAYKTYFGYDNASVQGVERSNYTTSSWIQLLKDELDAGRPINYAGWGSGGGHAFVCDGYDSNDFFHFNWGWGGSFDGFFLIDALNPSGVGTGGGNGGFNNGHQAVIGIKPPDGLITYSMELYAALTPSASSISFGQGFDVTTNIFNSGTTNFSGDYGVAVFDDNLSFVDFVEEKIGWTLSAGYVYTNNVSFSTAGLLSMLPGTYYVALYYRTTGGNWVQVANGPHTNWATITVTNQNDIELNSDMVLTPAPDWTQGESASVNVNIHNAGTSTFTGTYSVDLYGLDGSWVEEIGTYTETNGLPAGYTYLAPFLTFNTSAITSEPGTYFLAVQHFPSGGSWELTGSTTHQNPIYVTIKAPIVHPDPYEPNDTELTAYQFSSSFTGNQAMIETTGSTNHTGEEYDYYEVVLPPGYNYTLSPRAHDSYDSGNGNSYTADVLWSYSTGAGWSNTYDDVLGSSIEVVDGGTVLFHVAPYFPGERGSYVLEIPISRVTTGIDNELPEHSFHLYPNPSTEAIFVKNESKQKIEDISLFEISGRLLKSIPSDRTFEEISIPVDDLAEGTYFLMIQTENGIWQQRFIKSN